MQLDFRQALDLINWCIANRIDYDRANDLKFAWYAKSRPSPGQDIWELEIPEEDMTYWMLKWE